MDDDQQFCLRWNNHQSTLVAVFDTLLENGTLVDCTLAAEGKCLNAHKVVLSACSPYFEALLSKHFDKHPILILKDVKFQELKAMMDYMYRGEVNISQDQLGALLKAAESLQIKGLSDNRKGETERKPAPAPPPPKSPQPASTLPKVQGLTIEQRARDDSREGSVSPGPRKKKRMRRKSEEMDNHDASNSSESHSLPAQNIPTLPAVTKMNADVPEQVETKSEILTRHKMTDDMPQVPIIKEKIETHTELMLEPKSEYVDEMNEDSIEDLTLDDDDLSNMEQMDDGAGPSHGNTGEGSSQGFGWHMGNQSQDEVFLAAQEAVGAHRDSQDGTYELKIHNVISIASANRSTQTESKKRKRRIRKREKKVTPKTVSFRCIFCGSFVKRGQQLCPKCKEDESMNEALDDEVARTIRSGSNISKPRGIERRRFSRNTRSSTPAIGLQLNLLTKMKSNYGKTCEACILLKENGDHACPACQRKINLPPNAFNYGRTCEACILLKENGDMACPACQRKINLPPNAFNYGRTCEACILLKDNGDMACPACQRRPDKPKQANKSESVIDNKGWNNKKADDTEINKNNDRQKAKESPEKNDENNKSIGLTNGDDDEDDEFDEYVSLRDLMKQDS